MPQFTIPPHIAATLMLPLPKARPVAVDLAMGSGMLLRQCTPSQLALGIDADHGMARKPANAPGQWNCLAAELPLLYPLLTEVNWQADLFVLNPHFPVQWPSAAFLDFNSSEVPAVRNTDLAQSETIDSTFATYLTALDLMSHRGEGMLICSEAVATRIFGESTASCTGRVALNLEPRSHIWLWVTLPPGTLGDSNAFETAVIYFARDHFSMLPFHLKTADFPGQPLDFLLSNIRNSRFCQRRGDAVNGIYDVGRRSGKLFAAVKEEYAMRHGGKSRPWNLWLTSNGTLSARLTDFQTHSWKIPQDRSAELLKLVGNTPAGLAVQKAERVELLRAVHCDLWHIEPGLIAAVEESIASYNTFRAPLYPLNPMQRLGYLDEEDSIECIADGLEGFTAGNRYPLSNRPVLVEKFASRINFIGEEESLIISGDELCFVIHDDDGAPHDFMAPSQAESTRGSTEPDDTTHTLETLVAYFLIPDVPDVAVLHKDLYDGYVAQLHAMEARLAS